MRYVMVACTLVFVILFVNTPLVTQPRLTDQFKQAKNTLSEITPLNEINSSITILSDMDFISQNFPGNGSLSNPYIIENQRIESAKSCIRIENTRTHFIIRNCHLWHRAEYTGGLPELSGIYFGNVTLGNLTDCYIESSAEICIQTFKCQNLSFSFNILKEQKDAFSGSADQGFNLINSIFMSLKNNTIVGFEDPIYESDCSDCIMENNLICESSCGVDESGPEIQHSKRLDYTITVVGPFLGHNFAAEVTDENGVSCVILYYRLSENASYTKLELTSEDNDYRIYIEFELEDPNRLNLWYFYWANDSLGNWRITPIDCWFLQSAPGPFPTAPTTNTTPDSIFTLLLTFVTSVGVPIVIIIVLFVMYRKRE